LSAQETDGRMAPDFMEHWGKVYINKTAVCDLQQTAQQIHD